MNHNAFKTSMKRLSFLLLALLFASAHAQTYEECVAYGIRAGQGDSLAQAERWFEKALETAPKDHRNALVYNDLGKLRETIFQQTGDTRKAEDALAAYSRAVELAPEAISFRMSRAGFYLRQKDWAKAEADLETVVDLQPGHIQARNYRAFALSQQRKYDQAKAEYERILSMDSGNFDAKMGLAVLEQSTGHLGLALQQVSQLIEEYPQRPDLLRMRAEIYKANNQPELALIDLDEAISLQPDEAQNWLARTRVHKVRGSKFYALRDYEQAIRLGVPRSSLQKEIKDCE